MPDLAAVRVRITVGNAGSHSYPDFTQLAIMQEHFAVLEGDIGRPLTALEQDRAWKKWLDSAPNFGWRYDQKSSIHHDDPDDNSPVGILRGIAIVSPRFCFEADAMFGARCQYLTDSNAATFYNTRVVPRDDDEDRDNSILTGLSTERDLLEWLLAQTHAPLTGPQSMMVTQRLQTLVPKALDAVDINNDRPGVRPNVIKNWAQFKTHYSVNYIEPADYAGWVPTRVR